jgi:tetratricopeptide (TPR) repeat protein
LQFVVFLKDIRKNYNQAEKYYKKALELEPDNANINNNYALFLKDIHKNDDQAEKHYKKALELKPDNAEISCETQNFWDIFSVLFGIFHFSYQDLSLFQLAIRNPTKRVIVLLMLLIHHFLYLLFYLTPPVSLGISLLYPCFRRRAFNCDWLWWLRHGHYGLFTRNHQ